MQTPLPFSSGSASPRARAPAGACDCHVHVYDARFPAASGARLLPPDATIAQYRHTQRRLGLSRAVLVTPSTYGADNRSMLAGLAELEDAGRGVAVIDGSESDGQLQAMHAAGVRGVRLNLSLGVVGSIEHVPLLADRIAALGWHLQLLMPPELLARQAALLSALSVPIVFDHFGRITPPEAGRHAAHALVVRLLEQGRAWVKLSGGYIVSARRSTDDPALHALARSYIDANPQRVLWGSDWPHATASAGLQAMPDDARQLDRLADWAGRHSAQILVSNPAALYGFGGPIKP